MTELRVVSGGRHGQPGYYSLSDLPQRESIAKVAVGTGWPEMDELWKLYPGQFTMVSGVAGHGKSTFLLNVVCNLARTQGFGSFLYVPENEGFLRDKLKMIWGANDGFDLFAKTQCFIQSAVPEYYGSAAKTLDWVLDHAGRSVENDGVDLVLIDPWNELERAKPKDQLLTDYIGECLMKLKQFCRSTACTVILVAHPTKAGISDGKVPGLADIEGSMNWFNKCDNGLIVVRDQDKPTSRVISAKVREIGAGRRGACYFYVDEKTGIFTPQTGAVTL
jgi:twinkle protein